MNWLKKLLDRLDVYVPWGAATAKPFGTMSARVWHADTQTWEDLGVISTFGKETV